MTIDECRRFGMSNVELRNAIYFISSNIITQAVKYPKFVIPAQAGIQKNTGGRIKSGLTGLAV